MLGYLKKTKAVEQEQVFQDQLLSKMSKTMDLVARLDAYNTGDNQTRVSKLLGYLFIPHVDFFGFPQSCFHKLALWPHQVPGSPWEKDGCHAVCLRWVGSCSHGRWPNHPTYCRAPCPNTKTYWGNLSHQSWNTIPSIISATIYYIIYIYIFVGPVQGRRKTWRAQWMQPWPRFLACILLS